MTFRQSSADGTARDAGVRTTCPYCGVGCGVLATPDGRGSAEIAGDAGHPANFGRLCSKGSALGETLGLENRLLHPNVDGAGVSWDAALDTVADGFRRTADRYGPEAIAFYLSGQLLTEDYYVANKLAKGFLGTPHVDTNSRLCMSSAVAAHRRAFGSDTVPGCYEDLDEADLIVLVGSNTAWCHPILFHRMVDARAKRGTKLVVIDPRRTQTGEEADLFLGLKPGSDTALFSGLLAHLVGTGSLDYRFVLDHTSGFQAALDRARAIAPTISATAAATGLSEADVAQFFELFARTKRVVTAFSQGVNQSAQGTDKGNAIINCHLATGRIGRPGAGPFSLTGQPNAMGGREVGGLANMLAAHMHFAPEEVDRVRRFWKAPNIITGEGMKAVALFEAIERGKIKALWVMGTNPVVSMPRADAVRESLKGLDLYVVSEAVADSDSARAVGRRTVLLPALAWGEKDGTVTNSERRISRQRSFLKAPGEARADWRITCDVAKRLGHGEAFAYSGPAAIFREHAALSAFENGGARAFDIGALAAWSDDAYAAAAPLRWPARHVSDGGIPADGVRLYGDGRFHTPDGRGRFVAVASPTLATTRSDRLPLLLNTGRVRDQWHTMTRTGRSARLSSHRPIPFVEVHPSDAESLGLRERDLARLSTLTGGAILEVRIVPGGRRGEVFAPIHWSAATASHARVGALVLGTPDPVSGQPELKATPAVLEPLRVSVRGQLLTAGPATFPEGWWWCRWPVEGGWLHAFATVEDLDAVDSFFRALRSDASHCSFEDRSNGLLRVAAFSDERLLATLDARSDGLPSGQGSLDDRRPGDRFAAADRRETISRGRAVPSGGPVVCACNGVGPAAILRTIGEGSRSVAAIGASCAAGTGCGSCIPEIRKLLEQALA
jgi:assimilatory nitrate reductase catalytic subunit